MGQDTQVETESPRGDDPELIGPARFIRIGHTPQDNFVQRQSKSILAAVMLFFGAWAIVFFFDPNRSTFIHAVDLFSAFACGGVLLVLHLSKSLKLTFTVISTISVVLIITFLLIVGNRGADLILPLFFPLLSIVTIGPRASRWWIGIYVVTLVSLYLVGPMLPQVNVDWMVSPENPEGSLFHAPDKRPLDGTSLVTAILGALTAYAIVYYSYTQMIHSRNVVAAQRVELARAYEKSENLLRNILPDSVAERLKEDPKTTIADDLDDVAILIADIVDFTATAARMPASQVVMLLNEVFSEFDTLVSGLGLEKIKTSGDAYMVAAGIGERSATDLEKVADLALDMQRAAHAVRDRHKINLEVRIGIHSGLATAGVVGTLKFYYDIWGDTVNMAARLQSAARPGTIRVSQQVYTELAGQFRFSSSGETKLKGKGTVQSYELIGRAGKPGDPVPLRDAA